MSHRMLAAHVSISHEILKFKEKTDSGTDPIKQELKPGLPFFHVPRFVWFWYNITLLMGGETDPDSSPP